MPDTVATMFQNLGTSFPGLFHLVYISFWLTGFICVVWGVNRLKQANSDQGQSGGGASPVTGALVSILIGAALMYMPTLLQSMAVTVFGADVASPAGLVDYETPAEAGSNTFLNLRTFIQLVGVYFFGRGWLGLRDVGVKGEGHGGATFYGSVVRIFAGIMLVHIVDTLRLLATTVGLSSVTNLLQNFGG